MTPKELLERLQSFSIDKALSDIVAENENIILEMNKQQLFSGKNTEGSIIGVYSPFTDSITKGTQGKGFPKTLGTPYNLFDTGETQNSTTINYKGGVIYFFNRGSHTNDLFETIKKHGFINNPEDTLFGLQEKDITILIDTILTPDLAKLLQKKIK